MDHADEFIEGFRERQSELIGQVMDLEKRWPEDETGQLMLDGRANELIKGLRELGDEMSEAFLSRPVSAMHNATFAWTYYEIANARLNLTYLLLFGVNAHHPDAGHPRAYKDGKP